MPKVSSRAQYDPKQEAENVLKQIPPDKLKDKAFVFAAVKGAGVKLTPITVGRIRVRLLKENAGYSSNGSSNGFDLQEATSSVLKLLPKVGGMVGLEKVISHIKEVKERYHG